MTGANPGQSCVFPFIHNGKKYSGCPIDPKDSSKRWCSTKTDSKGYHVINENQWGHCSNSCPVDDNGQITTCHTISGPNPNKKCIFPFKHAGKTYFGCPIDPEDKTKRWCSTQVDSGGNHVTNKGQYGHCATNCPQDKQNSNSCGFGQKCRTFAACASQSTSGNQICNLDNGNKGLCCKDITNINPRPLDSNGKGPSLNLPRSFVENAINSGSDFAENQTLTQKNGLFRPGTPEWSHSKLQRPKEECKNLNKLALTSAHACEKLGIDSNSDQFRLYGISGQSSSLTLNCPKTPKCFLSKYRSADGSCNNFRQPKYGQTLTPVQRILPNAYSDGLLKPRNSQNGRDLPSARQVSVSVTSKEAKPSRLNTNLFMAVGQFLDHDLTHVPMHDSDGNGVDCCNVPRNGFEDFTACLPISIPANDPFYQGRKRCMNFARSMGAIDLDCQLGPLQQVNQITHWIDSSNVYGSSKEESRRLRSFQSGLLRTEILNGEELLPPNNDEKCIGGPSERCFLAGDGRVNEQPNLAVMHTLFMREHNRIARQLKNLNPRWNDETLYQESKRIVNAEWQHIVYNEWLPIVIGQQYMRTFGIFPLTQGFSNNYNTDLDPRITNAFASAAFRIGHTLIPGK